MRSELVQRVRETLTRSGFYLNADASLRPASFDVVARRDGELLIVKVLMNVDSFSEAVAHEMRTLAGFLGGTPLLVGERSSSRDLATSAVYERHGVRILNVETLDELLLEGVPPLVYAAPGGFYVTIDGARLRAIREERGISLGQLAEAAGVSRRAISMYEEGMGAMVDVAHKLEDFLEEGIVRPIDPFAASEKRAAEVVVDLERLREGLEREIFSLMQGIGFRVIPLGKSPINAISARNEGTEPGSILTGVGEGDRTMADKARAIASLSSVTETYGAFFVERRTGTRVAVEGTAVIGKDELARMDDPSDVLELIRERRAKRR